MIGTTGDDLIREAGGGLVVVTFDYRLGVFGTRSSYPRPCRVLSYCSFLIGFLAGEQVHQKGALNAGLREQIIGVSMIEN